MKRIWIGLLGAGLIIVVFAVPVSAADPLLTPIGTVVEPIAAFLNDQGVHFFSEGRMDAAMTSFAAAIDREPGFSRAHFNAALTLARGGDLETAIRHMEEAITQDPMRKDGLTAGAAEEARDLVVRWRKVHFNGKVNYESGWGGFFEYGLPALLGFGIAFCAYGWILYDHGIPGVGEMPVEEVYEFKKAA